MWGFGARRNLPFLEGGVGGGGGGGVSKCKTSIALYSQNHISKRYDKIKKIYKLLVLLLSAGTATT